MPATKRNIALPENFQSDSGILQIKRDKLLRLFLIFTLAAAIFLIDCIAPLGIAIEMMYMIVVLLSLLLIPEHTIRAGIYCSLMVIAGAIVSPEGNSPLIIAVENRLVSILVIGLTMFFASLHIRTAGALDMVEQQASAVLNNIIDSIITIDETGIIKSANPATKEMFGYSREELEGKKINILMPSPHREAHDDYIERYLKSGDARIIGSGREVEAVRKDGRIINVHLEVTEAIVGGQRLFTGIMRDLSDFKQEEKRRLSNIIESYYDGIMVIDQEGNIQYANPVSEEITGKSREELIGETFGFAMVEGEQSEISLLRRDRSRIVAEMRTRQIEWNNRPATLVALRDITARKKLEDRLKLLATVFESATEAIFITSATGEILEINDAFTKITGYERDEVIGKNPNILNSGKHSRIFFKRMWQCLNETGSWSGELWNRRKDGSIYPQWNAMGTVHDELGKITHYVCIAADISQVKEFEEKLWDMAHFDPVTNLPNRMLLMDRIQQSLRNAKRNQSLVGILFFDIDNFKDINDSMGHAVGDKALKILADKLTEIVREKDTIARHGGDEFILLIDNIVRSSDASLIASKVLKVMEQPINLENRKIYLNCSIGIAIYPNDGIDANTLIKNADAAMFRSKAEGGNTYRFYTEELTVKSMELITLSADLREADFDREMLLYFQPILDYREEKARLVGAETLIRWQHPERGFMTPDKFIPVAESSGTIGSISKWIITKVCQVIAEQLSFGMSRIFFTCNVTAFEFENDDFINHLEETINETGIDPALLLLEVTESIFLKEKTDIFERLEKVREMGVKISIDDFGTGYSSLGYLKRWPVDKLKIDRSYVDGLPDDENDKAVCLAIISLAHSLNMSVVGEGVENNAHEKSLIKMGCDEGQGFYYSKPMPKQEFYNYLEGIIRSESATIQKKKAG